MFLTKVQCTGQAWLAGAHIGGQLACIEAVFTNPTGNALNADGLVVDGDMFLTKVQCTGQVRLAGAHISGQLACIEAVFTNPTGNALNADGLVVDGDMFLRKVQCTGQARLLGAHISGPLDCTEAVFTNPTGNALSADRLVVDADMVLRKAQCTGVVRLLGAHISGPLDCTEAVFSNPDGDALNADRLVVDGSMFLGKAQCTGQAWLASAHINGQLTCTEAVFVNPERQAVVLLAASVVHDVIMRPDVLDGTLDLTRARVGAWKDAKTTWPSRLRLEGFVYDAIDQDAASVEDRLRSWLPRKPYRPQPYEQLAGVYRREGNEQAARTVLIGKQRARRADHAHWWRRWPAMAWSAVLRWTHRLWLPPGLDVDPAGCAGGSRLDALLASLTKLRPPPLIICIRPSRDHRNSRHSTRSVTPWICCCRW